MVKTTPLLPDMLQSFKEGLRTNYFQDKNIQLIDTELPTHFNNLRQNGIKIA